MKKIISIILLCSLLLVCFFGCSISDLDDVNGTTSGEDGTTTGEDGTTSNNEINSTPDDIKYVIIESDLSGDPMSQYSMSVKIPDKCELSNAVIPISVSYGLGEGGGITDESFTDILLIAENGNDQKIILKKLKIDEILKSEYAVEYIWDENRQWIIGFNFTHSESFELPLSLFSGDSGQVHVVMYECANTDSETVSRGAGAYIYFFYTRNETSISISAEVRGG